MSTLWKISNDNRSPLRGVLTWPNCEVEMAFRLIKRPLGGFRKGSRGHYPDEEPVHRVEIGHDYWLGETPVTQAQFALWTRDHEPEHKNEFEDQPEYPAESMDWWQAVRYCEWLTQEMSEQFPDRMNLVCLPTEAEWEWACRAGSDTRFHTGDGDAALA
jgi:formylglycine-generating enzyme required for sulfatase activity